ncbi:elongation factor P 5-aminopentanone reductase [Lachnospira pectinoschiza]|uniref:3-oxoacyl-[acyl-carrier protein] reductase n=1 Tax=Lachnospira pectinoschiza TaxID=28052 RepID=A0A1G9XCQ0_9FIRM|nr:SDR family NAD(P)-dependent oxidoreductase [Lachnospira pectinoschiza]SDM94589.1 3-oxoacyl-[acyl-carrier protein] reductase [Lachnospira pectinoschiza]
MSRNIIITGASRGIGKAIAKNLAGPDTNILISSFHNSSLLEETKKELSCISNKVISFTGDMGNYEDVEKMFDLALKEFGSVDVLINNAGISMVGLFQDMSYKEWQEILNTNLGSVYNCCHFAVNDMIKRHEGKIINISSVWGLYGASCEVAYSATKGGVDAFTKALAKELAPSNIQVNAIACGAIDTEMNGHLSKEELEELALEIPERRLGEPSEVAELVRKILESPSYLTGQIIQFDGGWI